MESVAGGDAGPFMDVPGIGLCPVVVDPPQAASPSPKAADSPRPLMIRVKEFMVVFPDGTRRCVCD
jgi:hypothetical protein